MRGRISIKLAAIWLAVAIPLFGVLFAGYYHWYSARLSLIREQRLDYARLSGRSFGVLIEDMRRSMRFAGPTVSKSESNAGAELMRVAEPYPVAYAALADTAGRVLAASDRRLVGADVSSDTAFRRAVEAPVRGGIEPSEVSSDGLVGFHVAQAFGPAGERPEGVMLMFVDVRELHRSFPVTVTTGGTSIVDSDGQVVYQSEDPRLAETRARWGEIPCVRLALEGRTSTSLDFQYPPAARRIAVFVPIATLGWASGSAVDADVAMAPFRLALFAGLPVAVALVVATLAAVFVAMRRVHRSLASLAGEAKRIGTGDLDRPVRTDRTDEIGEVERSLEGARRELREARQQVSRELETTRRLLDAARGLAEWTDPEAVLGSLAAATLGSTRHTRSFVFLWDESRRELTCAAAEGEKTFPVGVAFGFGRLSAPTQQLISDHLTRVVDFDTLPAEERGSVLEGSHILLEVPLVRHGRTIGLIGVDDPGERREFTSREVEIIEAMSAQAAVAIENAQLLEATQEAARLNEALNSVDASIHSTLRFDEVMQHALDEGVRALGCDAGAVEMREGESWVVRYQRGFSGSDVGMSLSDDEAPSAFRVERLREPMATEDMPADEKANVGFVKRYGLKSVLAVPLWVRGTVAGCALFYTTSVRRFSEAEMDFGRKLGASVALALENARLYEGEHRVAETLQEALLALPERLPGIRFAHSYHSATETSRVGGDFYDVFELGGLFGITIGDVSGKGLDAAVLTSLVKNAIRAQAIEERKTPGGVLAVANELLYKESPPEVFVTVFFGVLDAQAGRIIYCNAGHTTGMVCPKHGGVELLPANSPLVGAFEDVRFEDSEARLSAGDVLFLYTDGLTEARSDSELFGEERLYELLHEVAGRSPQALVQRAVDSAVEFSGGTLRDDLAVLALRVGE